MESILARRPSKVIKVPQPPIYFIYYSREQYIVRGVSEGVADVILYVD